MKYNLFSIYLGCLLVTLFLFLSNIPIIHSRLFSYFSFVILLVPVFIVFFEKKKKNTVFLIFTLGAVWGGIFYTFRYFRSLFPQPMINSYGIVGFAQYYGYPFIFDNILFVLFLITAFVIGFHLRRK